MGTLTKKLYILHGWSASTDKWKEFLTALEKQNITPIFLKIPGFTAPLNTPWGLDNYVEWLHSQIPKGEKIILLGHSNGGRIGLSFAYKYPEKIKQLFLMDSAGIYHNDFFSKTKRKVFKVISVVGKRITKSKNAKSLLYKLAREGDYKNATPVMRETMKNLISVDLSPALHEIKTPTVIIWGENDLVTPYSDALIMENGLPNAKLFPISGGRHSPQFTHVDEVVKIVSSQYEHF